MYRGEKKKKQHPNDTYAVTHQIRYCHSEKQD